MILGSKSDALLKADRRRLEAISEAFSASWTLSTARLAWSFSALFLGALPWRPVTSVFESHWDGWQLTLTSVSVSVALNGGFVQQLPG